MAKYRRGRSTKGERFIRLPHFLVRSAAWKALSLPGRAIFIEVLAIYNGSNNGYLGFTARQAAEALNCSKDTASKAFLELRDKGFLEVVKFGRFAIKARLATEYRVTLYECDSTKKPASKNFMRWPHQKFSDGPISGTHGPISGTVTPFRPPKTASTVR